VVGEHVWREAGLLVHDVLAQGSYEVGFGPYGRVMSEGGDLFQ